MSYNLPVPLQSISLYVGGIFQTQNNHHNSYKNFFSLFFKETLNFVLERLFVFFRACNWFLIGWKQKACTQNSKKSARVSAPDTRFKINKNKLNKPQTKIVKTENSRNARRKWKDVESNAQCVNVLRYSFVQFISKTSFFTKNKKKIREITAFLCK